MSVLLFVRDGSTEIQEKSEPRLQFNNFQLLQDVMDAYAKKLSIQLNIKGINEQKIIEIQELLNMHKGKHLLYFVVYDDEESIVLELKSRQQKIQISQNY